MVRAKENEKLKGKRKENYSIKGIKKYTSGLGWKSYGAQEDK